MAIGPVVGTAAGTVPGVSLRDALGTLKGPPERAIGAAGGTAPVIQILRLSLWGTIIWPRLLGRPRVPDLGSAFAVRHFRVLEVPDQDPKTPIHKIQEPRPAPSAWDATEADGPFRVNFMAIGEPAVPPGRLGPGTPNYNRFEVALADGVGWDWGIGTPRGVLEVVPAEASVTFEVGPVHLAPFELRRLPLPFHP